MSHEALRSISVVVPLFNEADSIAALVEAVRAALGRDIGWELILVDDGSRDATAQIARSLSAADSRIVLVQLARNYGQTPAMQAGFDRASGQVVVSMDGDLQNDPADILRLVEKLEEGYDLVTGYRVRRQDRVVSRKLPSWIANRLIRRITGVQIRDNGCSLKAYRRELLDRLHLYSDLHRFIPALAASTAGARITEIPVRHHARRFGQSKYGISRVAKVLADLITIKMIRSFRERPLLMFSLGAIAALSGAMLFSAATVAAYLQFSSTKAAALVFPAVAMLFLGLAAYLLMLGLLAEVALRHRRQTFLERVPVVHEVH